MTEECNIQYCKYCEKFFLDSCSCPKKPSPSNGALSSMASGIFAMIRKLREQSRKPAPLFGSKNLRFSKYIDLANPDAHFGPSPIRDYYVYMFAVHQKGVSSLGQQPSKLSESKSPTLSSSSAVSVVSKKSASGSIFKHFIGKSRKKKSEEECVTNPFVEHEEDSCFSEDEHNVITERPSKSRIPVLKKALSRTTSHLAMEGKHDYGSAYLKSEPLSKHSSYGDLRAPTRIESDFREVHKILSEVKESEAHIAHLISTHVQDGSLQEELLQALTNHSNLHSEVKQQAQTFTNQLWQHQTEIVRNREAQLQERLTSVVQHNRNLQDVVDELVEKNEKLCVKLQQFPARERSPDTSSALLEAMSKNNDKLRTNIGELVGKIGNLEKNLEKLQNKNQILEEQLRDATSQMQNYKDARQRMEMDHKLEHDRLVHELQQRDVLLNQSSEAGKTLLEDLDKVKNQMQSISYSINWTKFNSKDHSLPDIIVQCRSCIDELTKELLLMFNNISIKDKDIQCLKEEISRNEEQLDQHKFEENRLRNELKIMSHVESELQTYKSKLMDSERRFEEYQIEVEKNKMEEQESCMRLKNEVMEKDEELLLLKEQAVEYKSENDALRMQLQGLKQVLSSSGTGDVAKELAETQEKLAAFQAHYYQILSENNSFVEKLHSANAERLTFSELQSSSSRFVHAQQHELDTLKRDYRTLRQQYDLEHQQAMSLRLERNKLREEKAVLKQIYLQLKNEIGRVQALEGKFIGMNMEANRLAVIADYNKQLGEKLQCEVAERDVKITALENNMQELNNAQIESAKDKVALCVELSEVCSLNKKLNSSLVNKHQKLDELHETKKQIETAASAQLRAAEHMQKVERAALVELLHDYKRVVAQRDGLSHAQSEYVKQLTELRANTAILTKNIETANQSHMHNKQLIQNLESKLHASTTEIKALHFQIRSKDQECSQIKLTMEEMRKQGQALESSVPYLQNTIQHLHKDLNRSRESEMELHRALLGETKRIETAEDLLERERRALHDAHLENEELCRKIAQITAQYDDHLQEHRKVVEQLALEKDKDKRCAELELEIKTKNGQLEKLQDNFNMLTLQVCEMESCMAKFDEQSEMLMTMKSEISKLHTEHEQCTYVIERLRKAKEALDLALQSETHKVEVQKNYIEKLTTEHTEICNGMENDLVVLSEEFEDMKAKYAKIKVEHEDLKRKQKYLTGELLHATQMVIDEKASRLETGAQINQLVREKTEINAVKESLAKEVGDLQTKIAEQGKDKKKLQAIVEHLEGVKAQLEAQLQSSEKKFAIVQSKLEQSEGAYKELERSLTDAHNCAYISQEIMEAEKKVFGDSQKMNAELKMEIEKLKHNLTALEFQKSEVTLRMHELKVALRTEENINAEMTKINQEMIGELLQLENNDLLPQVLEKFIRPNSSRQNL